MATLIGYHRIARKTPAASFAPRPSFASPSAQLGKLSMSNPHSIESLLKEFLRLTHYSMPSSSYQRRQALLADLQEEITTWSQELTGSNLDPSKLSKLLHHAVAMAEVSFSLIVIDKYSHPPQKLSYHDHDYSIQLQIATFTW
jgi:hypothetical protein